MVLGMKLKEIHLTIDIKLFSERGSEITIRISCLARLNNLYMTYFESLAVLVKFV